MADQQQNFLARLKQHHLYGVIVAYAVVAAFLIQLVSRVFPYFGWAGAIPAVIVVLLLGFPVVVVLAWSFIKPKDPAKTDIWQRRHWKFSAAVTIAVIVLVVISGFYGLRYSKRYAAQLEGATAATTNVAESTATTIAAPSVATVIPAKSIAVLPFENLSTDKANAYFADGMQDLILTKLADIGDLKVISRTSTVQYASHPEDLKTIGQQLGVAAILEGSVQKAGNQVLINVQLIDARTDNHIWAESYQRTLDNVFGVEGEVAEKVADALQAKLTPGENSRLATAMSGDATANDLFLRAEYFSNRGDLNYDASAFRQAIPLYRQALARDPGFALARAQLSYAESGAVWFGSGEGDVHQLAADAEAQAQQALAQQPGLVAAYLALGYSAYWTRQDFPGALKAFAAALKLRPNDADAFAATGYVLRRQGRFDAAIKTLQQALVLDPRNSGLATGLGETMAAAGHHNEAGQAFRRAMGLDPDNFQAQSDSSANILLGTGDIPRALAAAQGNNPELQWWRAQLLTIQRKYREALALIAGIPDNSSTFIYQIGPKPLRLANLYRLMGDTARAQLLYEQALLQSRTRLTELAGSTIKMAYVWNHIADAELGLGRTDAALAAIAKSQALAVQSGDRFFEPWVAILNAKLYAQANRADLAVPLLDTAIIGAQGFYSPVLLWLDPAWDPIRHDPRFQALLKQYAKYKPAVNYDTAPAASSSSR